MSFFDSKATHTPIGSDEFLRRKVEAGRASMRAGQGTPNDDVEAQFAPRRAQVPSPS